MSNFKFNFDKDSEKAAEFTTKNQEFLQQIERRIAGVTAQGASERCESVSVEEAEREVTRLQAAFKDVKKQMSKKEFAEYEAVVAAHKPKALSKEEQAALTKEMDKNKDKPSH